MTKMRFQTMEEERQFQTDNQRNEMDGRNNIMRWMKEITFHTMDKIN